MLVKQSSAVASAISKLVLLDELRLAVIAQQRSTEVKRRTGKHCGGSEIDTIDAKMISID